MVQAKLGYREALNAVVMAETPEEQASLSVLVAAQYNLTMATAKADLQHEDREIRTLMLQALPLLHAHLEQQASKPWAETVNTLLMIDPDLNSALNGLVLYGDGLESQALTAVMIKGGPQARIKHVVEIVVAQLRAEAARDPNQPLETALGRCWHRLGRIHPRELQPEALTQEKGTPISGILRRFMSTSGNDFRWLTDALDETLSGAPPVRSTAELLGQTLARHYQNSLRTTLAVCAWHRLGWTPELYGKTPQNTKWGDYDTVRLRLTTHLAQLGTAVSTEDLQHTAAPSPGPKRAQRIR